MHYYEYLNAFKTTYISKEKYKNQSLYFNVRLFIKNSSQIKTQTHNT